MGPESGRPAGQKILNSAHLESRSRLHLAGDKSLMDLAYQATAGSFPHLCVGKFAQAAIGNPLKMIDVGSPPGALTPGSNFAALRALARCGCGREGALRENPPPLSGAPAASRRGRSRGRRGGRHGRAGRRADPACAPSTARRASRTASAGCRVRSSGAGSTHRGLVAMWSTCVARRPQRSTVQR